MLRFISSVIVGALIGGGVDLYFWWDSWHPEDYNWPWITIGTVLGVIGGLPVPSVVRWVFAGAPLGFIVYVLVGAFFFPTLRHGFMPAFAVDLYHTNVTTWVFIIGGMILFGIMGAQLRKEERDAAVLARQAEASQRSEHEGKEE